MKIAITGSHGTGKTTLAQALAEELDMHLIPEAAREIMEKWQVEPWNLDDPTKTAFQEEVLDIQIKREQQAESFISDRTVFDSLAYSKMLASYEQLSELAVAHVAVSPYDLVIRLPIVFEIDNDGRSTDIEYQQLIDHNIIQELEKHNQRFVTIEGQTTVKDRVKIISEILTK